MDSQGRFSMLSLSARRREQDPCRLFRLGVSDSRQRPRGITSAWLAILVCYGGIRRAQQLGRGVDGLAPWQMGLAADVVAAQSQGAIIANPVTETISVGKR